MLNTQIGRGVIELTNGGVELFIARPPSGDHCGSSPRASNSKIDSGSKIAGTQRRFGERPGFANCIPVHGNHIEERTGRHVQKLSKEVLIHIERVPQIAANRGLHAPIEGEYVVSQMQSRVQPEVQGIISGIAVHNSICAGQRDLASGVPNLEETAGIRKAPKVQMKSASPFGLKGRPWQRKQSLAAGNRIWHVQRGIEQINSRVLVNGLQGKI